MYDCAKVLLQVNLIVDMVTGMLLNTRTVDREAYLNIENWIFVHLIILKMTCKNVKFDSFFII